MTQVVKRATIKGYLDNPSVKQRITDLLDKRAGQFTTSLLSLVSNDELLAQAEPGSLFNAALTAASLDLPINKNLGFAHIIGYKNNRKNIVEAQFQIGYKGFIQLAQRTGQYKTINATAVYEGQLVNEDPLGGNVYDWKAKVSDDVIGYVSRFTLVTGFESELYMSVDEITKHAKRYSQAYKSGYGPWKDNFDAMALKTVIKLNISKFGPQSTELQKALTFDQAVVKDEGTDPDYPDGMDLDNVGADEEKKNAIVDANTNKDIENVSKNAIKKKTDKKSSAPKSEENESQDDSEHQDDESDSDGEAPALNLGVEKSDNRSSSRARH